MMINSLQTLFQKLSAAKTEAELRCNFMDGVSEHFIVQRWGIYLLDEQNCLMSVDTEGVSNSFIERYQTIGKPVDRLLQYVQKYHAPAHERLVYPDGQWKQSQLYLRCCTEYRHEHIMTGPIVGNGKLMGTVHFARVDRTPAFSDLDLVYLSAVCLHLSANLAKLRSQSTNEHPFITQLTPRELQIANLVARGLTNKAIGRELWITDNSVKQALKRMFRKLNVASRTEMVVKLKDLLEI
ncbi:helix-turn-helix transcriptional regulator [Myxosarcina sp. GI1(2024)]